MRRSWLLILPLVAWSGIAAAETTVHVGVGSGNLQFDFLYSDFNADAPFVQREVAYVGEADLLVALYLARTCKMDVDVVVGWRRAGMSWDRITRRCHKDARVYYVEIPDGVSTPPYGRARGHWKKHPKGDLELTDAEVREFVLVQALAGHCGVSPTEIVRRRAAGDNAREIARSSKRSEDTAPEPPGRRSNAGVRSDKPAKAGHQAHTPAAGKKGGSKHR